MVKDFETGALRVFDFNNLLERIPELKLLDCDIQAVSFDKPIDSSNMNTHKWARLASLIEEHYNDFDGFVILHGSDTMSYSASALSFMLENVAKPVVFTGSQLPIGDLRKGGTYALSALNRAAFLSEGGPRVEEARPFQPHRRLVRHRGT